MWTLELRLEPGLPRPVLEPGLPRSISSRWQTRFVRWLAPESLVAFDRITQDGGGLIFPPAGFGTIPSLVPMLCVGTATAGHASRGRAYTATACEISALKLSTGFTTLCGINLYSHFFPVTLLITSHHAIAAFALTRVSSSSISFSALISRI